MSQGDNSPGMSKFVGVLDTLVGKRKDTSLVLDYGVIQDDLSLVTNTFPVPIPKKDYMCCRHLKSAGGTTGSSGNHSHPGGEGEEAGSHTHHYQIHQSLKKGDRVLVAWIQNDAVVIDVIVHGSDVF